VSPMTRRSLVRAGAAGALVAVSAGFPVSSAVARTRPRFSGNPFALGVASGDPSSDGAVLWTRLTTDTLGVDPLPAPRIAVRWEVAEDERFRRVVRRGVEVADVRSAHSVHVELRGLRPHREYWYRFAAGDEVSPVGRTRTAPGFGFGGGAEQLAFAVTSCQNYEAGYYAAWKDIAAQDLDLVLHLGDYIYEGAGKTDPPTATTPRRHVGPEITTLFDYRRRLALYRSDPDLLAAHAAHPFVVIWDDHEVDNNYAGLISQDDDPVDVFSTRRAAAYQAYYEHMPLRRAQVNRGPNLQLDRTLRYGDLAQFTMLDTRQYRSNQACGDGNKEPCGPEWEDPSRTFLGDEQERRVLTSLGRSRARWNVIGNQIPLTAIDQQAGPGQKLYMDGWAGYPVARDRFLQGIEDRRVRNPLVVTGDVHASWACEVNRDVRDPASRSAAVELIGTSITSGGDGTDVPTDVLPDNPQVKFQRSRRGWVKVGLNRKEARAEFRHLPFVAKPGAQIAVDATFTVQDGTPKLQRV